MLVKDPPQAAPEWLTPAQAARHLGVTPAMVRYWAKHGRVDYQMTPLGRLIGAESAERLRRARQGGSTATSEVA